MRLLPCIFILLLAGSVMADLTPSVRYFNFDYNGAVLVDSLDSIYAGRYEVLVADQGGTSWGTKYTAIYAYDNTFQFYQYLDLHNAWGESGNIGQINERMAGGLADSTSMYWHSLDSCEYDTSGSTSWMVPYSESEAGSRLIAYSGTRRLINLTAPNFATVFCDSYADSLKDVLIDAGWPVVTGIWGDNMTLPQTVGVSTCPSGRGRMWEDNLGDDEYFGCESWSDWHANYRDTQLVDALGVLGDSLWSRLSLQLCVNGNGWAGSDINPVQTNAYGFHKEFADTTKIGKVSREFEFGGRVYLAGEFFVPGPTNAASQIDSATVADPQCPPYFYKHQVEIALFGEEWWFNPRDLSASRHYGWNEAWIGALVQYYLVRSSATHLSFAVGPSYNELNWLTGAGDDACVAAGEDGDSCYWIDALGVRLGRDDDAAGWNTDTVRWYLGSVQCLQCMDTVGIGKDDVSQNFVIFLKRWVGDDGYSYVILHRTAGDNQATFTNSWSPTFDLPAGSWSKLTIVGAWGSAITQDSLRNGEGGIYRQETGGEDAGKANRERLLRMRRSVL